MVRASTLKIAVPQDTKVLLQTSRVLQQLHDEAVWETVASLKWLKGL